MVKKSTIRQYHASGKQLTVLAGKKPIESDWTNRKIDEETIFSHRGNLGWVIGEGDLVIDVDPRNGGDESYAKLEEDLKFEFAPTVSTPSGGFHVYLSTPEKYNDKKFKKTLKKYPGIDFLTKGSQCVIVGSTTEKGSYEWADDFFDEFHTEQAPKSIIDMLVKGTNKSSSSTLLGDFDGLINNDSMPVEKVLEVLSKLDPSVQNDEWVQIGMALHDWHSIKGLELWEDWSKDGDNYSEGETAKRWESFTSGGGITLGTVSYMAKEVDYDIEAKQVSEVLSKIKASTEKELEFELLPSIKKINLNKLNKEKVVKAVQDQFKALSGVRIPISNIRTLIGKEVLEGELVDEDELPKWCENWIYVNSHNGFINLDTLRLHKAESFNVENGKNVPPSEAGTKPSATKYISDRGFIKKVDSICYLPGVPELITEVEGSTVLNSFNSKTIPLEAKVYSTEGKAAVKLIKKHIKFICTTDKDTDLFLQWLAFQVQYPGKHILWSPVIQSIQGVGKSFFGELLRACLGDKNVGTVSPSQVTSDFNGWAANVVVNVLEELRVKGHNRYEAVNALKPLITDRIIQINEKGVTPYMTYNTTNYMCFTNYKDALPLDVDDRRWWVIFVPIQSLDDLPKYVGEMPGEYFAKLFHSISNYGSEIRKWLLEYPITEEFKRIKQAPMTQHKQLMINTEDDSFLGLTEVREIIESGNPYINKDCISQSDLMETLLFDYEEVTIHKKDVRLILKKLGYSLMGKVVKVEGKTRRVWVQSPLTNDEIRAKFVTSDDS